MNKFSSHITMLQKRQGKNYKSPFRKPDQSITSGDYLKQSACFVVEREKNLWEIIANFLYFFRLWGIFFERQVLAHFLAYASPPELLFLKALPAVHCFSACHGTCRLCVNPQLACSPQEVGRAGHKRKADLPSFKAKIWQSQLEHWQHLLCWLNVTLAGNFVWKDAAISRFKLLLATLLHSPAGSLCRQTELI